MSGQPQFEVFPEKQSFGAKEELKPEQFRWRFRAANGQISATAGEGFTRREDAHRAVNDFMHAAFRVVLGQRIGLDLAFEVVDVEEAD